MSRKVTPTYTLLNQVTLAAAASSVTFSGIPQNYGDLILVATAKGVTTNNGGYTGIRFNGDTGNNYSRVYMVGNGSTTASASESSVSYLNCFGFPGSSLTGIGNAVFSFMDYSATDKQKTILIRENDPAQAVSANAGRWASTSAITSIQLNALVNNFASGSTFNLFGVIS